MNKPKIEESSQYQNLIGEKKVNEFQKDDLEILDKYKNNINNIREKIDSCIKILSKTRYQRCTTR